jgi:hypothetical protein
MIIISYHTMSQFTAHEQIESPFGAGPAVSFRVPRRNSDRHRIKT